MGKKDFLIRIKISRKEAKERTCWLRVMDTSDNPELERERVALLREATELTLIFG